MKKVYKFWAKGTVPDGTKIKAQGEVVIDSEKDDLSETLHAAQMAAQAMKDIHPKFRHDGTTDRCVTFPTVQLLRGKTAKLNKARKDTPCPS